MDSNNVITVTNNLEELELDMSLWNNLTYDQRKISDMECTNKYGCTNIELYNSIKAKLVRIQSYTDSKEYLNEEFVPLYIKKEMDIESRIQKVQTSEYIQDNNKFVTIINDFISDSDPDYDLEFLNTIYNKYLSSGESYRNLSDEYNLQLWGRNVPEMYEYMKWKLESNRGEEQPKLYINTEDVNLIYYESEIKEASDNHDLLRYKILQLDCRINSKQRSLYESSVLSSFKNIPFKEYDYSEDITGITPFFTFDEYAELIGDINDTNPLDYIMISDQKKYYDIIKNGNLTNEQLIQLGWNPSVKVTAESIKYAREKQIRWLNENMKTNIIDISKYDSKAETYDRNDLMDINNTDKLYPVYIVLCYTGTLFGKMIRKVKGSKYSHAGIALNSSLTEIYSYKFDNIRGINGFDIESLDSYNDKNGDAKLKVLTFFVPESAYNKLVETLDYYKSNIKSTRYNFGNVLNIAINKSIEVTDNLTLVCSQFVYTVLKLCNIDLGINKSTNLVTPGDFESLNNKKVFLIYEGNKKKYDKFKIDNKINSLLNNRNYTQLNIMETLELIRHLKNDLLLEIFNCTSDDTIIREEMKSIRELLVAEPVIVFREAKLPFNFNKQGDMYIDLPKDLQEEYNEAHRLLYMYDASNINGIKHELARLFYINAIIEKKLKRIDKKDNKYKEYIDLRARVLNDYKTFFKVVIAAEPDFDFDNYLKHTDYYNKSIKIDNTTMKFTGSFIKVVLTMFTPLMK